jgi:hypothetical protein
MKVLWIVVILLLAVGTIWCVVYAGDNPSPRQIYNANRRIEHEGGIHTVKPYKSSKKYKYRYRDRCIDYDTKEEVPCPEPELEEGVTIRDGRKRHD